MTSFLYTPRAGSRWLTTSQSGSAIARLAHRQEVDAHDFERRRQARTGVRRVGFRRSARRQGRGLARRPDRPGRTIGRDAGHIRRPRRSTDRWCGAGRRRRWPRSTARPAARASSTLGRMPQLTTTMSVSRVVPSWKRSPHTRPWSLRICVVVMLSRTRTPIASSLRRSNSPPSASSCWTIRCGAASTTVTSRPWLTQAARRLQAEQAAADHHGAARNPARTC